MACIVMVSQGIGHLDVTPIEEINLGCNDLNHLPFEVSTEG